MWRAYLTGLFDTDGTLDDSGHGDGVFVPRLKQEGRGKVYSIGFLLNLLGIGVRIDERKPGENNREVLYDCVVRGVRSRKLFSKLIGSRLQSSKKRERASSGVGSAEDPVTEIDEVLSVEPAKSGGVGYAAFKVQGLLINNSFHISE